MIFRKEHGAANIATVIERKSRYTVLFRNNDRRSKPIMSQLIRHLAPLPVLAWTSGRPGHCVCRNTLGLTSP